MNKKLRQGDIIVFKAEDDWLSKAISWFTETDVSHAAMVYSEDSIVELGAGGVVNSKVEVVQGEGSYVMRLKTDLSPAPLIRRADEYLRAGVRYDFPALFLLAGLLLYHKITLDTAVTRVMEKIFAAAAFKLDEMIQHKVLHHDDPAMVCSQFVYQVFYDCGGQYQIEIKDSCIFDRSDREELISCVRLIDQLPPLSQLQYERTSSNDNLDAYFPEDVYTQNGIQLLAEELYKALLQSENNLSETPPPDAAACDLSPVISHAEKFLAGLWHLLTLSDYNLPLPALFVTPGDLVYHAENLTKEGTLSLKRIHNTIQ